MTIDAAALLHHLDIVAGERRTRAADASLAVAVDTVKHYQHERFRRTYADLLAGSRYRAAATFFLDELYGPHDFAERDAQFARVVPALVRMFPHDVVATVADLAELHAITEQMDTAMGRTITPPLTRRGYVEAWQAAGRRDLRARQVDLMLEIGSALGRYTRMRLLAQTLRLMRGPARAAGLAALQGFLERGFETFRAIGGPEEFLQTVALRERTLIDALFEIDAPSRMDLGLGDSCLVQLP